MRPGTTTQETERVEKLVKEVAADIKFVGMIMMQSWGHTPAVGVCRDRFPQDQRIHKFMAAMDLITTNRVSPPRGEFATGLSRIDGMTRARLPMRGSTS